MKRLILWVCMLLLMLDAIDIKQYDCTIDYETRSIMLNIIKKKYFDTSFENISIDTYGCLGKYHFVGYKTYKTDLSGRILESMACFDVFEKYTIHNTQGFCFNDEYRASISSIDKKGNYITIVSMWQDKIGKITNTYLTFKLINDSFYIHQYSKEIGHIDNKSNQEIIDKTLIFYRVFRDELQDKYKILLDSVNDDLLKKLESKCYDSGKCKDE